MKSELSVLPPLDGLKGRWFVNNLSKPIYTAGTDADVLPLICFMFSVIRVEQLHERRSAETANVTPVIRHLLRCCSHTGNLITALAGVK